MSDTALLNLLADIRAAAGDPKGKLMQDELVAHIADLRAKAETAATPDPETAVELAASLSDDIAEITASILRSMPSGISLVSRERIAQHIETSYIAGYMRSMKNQ